LDDLMREPAKTGRGDRDGRTSRSNSNTADAVRRDAKAEPNAMNSKTVEK
jgi:hypothetical protein